MARLAEGAKDLAVLVEFDDAIVSASTIQMSWSAMISRP
jgi:hypothetical protein